MNVVYSVIRLLLNNGVLLFEDLKKRAVELSFEGEEMRQWEGKT